MNIRLPAIISLLLGVGSITFSLEAEKDATRIFLPFDGQAAGRYSGKKLEKDWTKIKWSQCDRASIVSETDAFRERDGKCLRVRYLKGEIGSEKGGAAFRVKMQERDEYYLDYYVCTPSIPAGPTRRSELLEKENSYQDFLR